jgi:leucyl-tRNA synthetase
VVEESPTKEESKIIHKTIKKIEEDINNFSFNTSVSSFMIAVNELIALNCNKRSVLESLVILIEPFAPHIAEELWSKLGYDSSVSTVDFPTYDEKYLIDDTKIYPVSFNGKMKFKLEFPLEMSKEAIEKAVLNHEKTQKILDGNSPKKVIVVPGKIVNVVV